MKRRFKVIAWVNYETNAAGGTQAELEAETQFIAQLGDRLTRVLIFEAKEEL